MFDQSGQFQLTIHPNGRKAADEYYHNGQTWIEGRNESTYTINIKNNSSGRVLAIVSVDGLDILKGLPAGIHSQGYVINAYSNLNIPGWKVDSQTAAEFFFSKSSGSYVSQIGGDTNNLGVIGAMIFKEKVQKPFPTINPSWPNYYPNNNYPYRRATYDSFSPTLSATSSNSSSLTNAIASTGTGFGDATTWETTSTTFIRENEHQPNAILSIYYDDARALQKMGIQLRNSRNKAMTANPFPVYNNGVVPPPGWSGR